MTHTSPFAGPGRRLPLVVALLAALPALAQQTPPAAEAGKLETVIITATKRPQPLQTTPIAITVINGAALEEGNVNTLGAVTAGKLTMMKNTVDPMATESGVFAALLAQKGFCGTTPIFRANAYW